MTESKLLKNPDAQNTGVVAASSIPSMTVTGPYPGDFDFGRNCVDEPNVEFILEVKFKDGKITLEIESSNQWLRFIQPARDRHEQNVEFFSSTNGQIFIRTLRDLKMGDQLYAWYSDQLARDMGIPFLSLQNILGNQRYVCHKCDLAFKYPNPLKCHMGFSRSCRDEKEFGFARRNREPLFRPYINCNCVLNPVTLQIPEPQPSSSANNTKDSLTREMSFSAFRTPVSHSKVGVNSSDTRGQNLVKGHLSETPLNLTLRNMSLKTDVMSYTEPDVMKYTEPDVRQQVNLYNHFRSTLYPYSASVSPDYKCSKLYCDIWPHHQWHTMYQGSHSWPLKQNVSQSTALTRESLYLDKKSKCGLDYQVPLPKATDGEPLDLLPKSFFADKSKRGHLCIYCGKLYSRKYGLKIHLRTHTGYKPLKCKICLRPFGDPSNLNKHIRLHAEGDTPYRCEYCGKVLVRRRDLERHIKSRHPNTESNQGEVEEVGGSIDVESDIIVVT